MKEPKYSILIPIIKSKFLSIAIESVLKQIFSDWELILYDDCSPDDIKTVTKKFENDRIKYFKGEKNLGAKDPSKTWNRMLELANGQFVCLLGDDDFLSENFLEEIDKLILKYPKVDLFRAKLERVDEKNETILSGETLPEFETWEQMMYERNVKNRVQATTGYVLRKNALVEIGGYVNFPYACGSDDATYLLLAKNNGIASTNEAFGYWRKSSLNISDNATQKMNEYKMKFYLKWESDFLDKMFPSEVPLHELYQSTDGRLDKINLDSLEFQLGFARDEIDSTKDQLSEAQSQLAKISGVYSSREFKAAMLLQKIAKFLFPVGSARRKVAVGSWRIVKSFRRLMRKRKSEILFCVDRLKKSLKPRKSRKINFKSKKIVFIAHSYHVKTRSADFLLEYLKKFFEVEVIFDDSWKGKPFTDLSFVDGSYFAVIFWQLIPSHETIKKINNENIVFLPMYGGVPLDYEFWSNLRDLKFINFSKALHEILKNWGFESMYVQYFPDCGGFVPGKSNEVFFWQRLTKININTVVKLLGKNRLKIHVHRGLDPEQKFVQPAKEIEKKFEITYSDWFESRKEMWEKMGELIRQKGIYIAPRDLEGIGMSFLEAMAMGKVVIAVDNPTMNEYIEDGKTGFLFDPSDPKNIDLSNIKQIQKNCFDFMSEGRKKWEEDKSKIIDFMKKR